MATFDIPLYLTNGFIFVLLALGFFGISRSIYKITQSFTAQRKLIELLKKDPKKSSKIKNAFIEALKTHQQSKFREIEQMIKDEVMHLDNEKEQMRVLDAINNNTEDGKRRYITNIIAGATL